MAQLNKFAESLKEASALESFWNGWVTARAGKGKSLPQNIDDLFLKRELLFQMNMKIYTVHCLINQTNI